LNVHFHVLALDGVYLRDADGAPAVFHALSAPTEDDVALVARRTAQRVEKLLLRRGRSLDPQSDAGEDPLATEPALAATAAAAARGVDLLGERAGRPTLRLLDPQLARTGEPVAIVMGFNVHAGTAVPARDRQRLEQLCRYLARPPIAEQRLEALPDGRVRYTMKKPWRDGTLALVFEPEDLVARLCAMVPPPRWHLIRFHGVLAAHAALRPLVVPSPPPAVSTAELGEDAQLDLFPVASCGFGTGTDAAEADGDGAREPSRKPWAWLLRHVFAEDLQICERCGGRMRWREVATTADAIAKLLARNGLGARPPPPPIGRRRAAPEQLELALGT
jgi:hypothetical protein